MYSLGGGQLHLVGRELRDILEFRDNDKKITGISGDSWNLLAEYLNFSLVITRTDAKTLETLLGLNNSSMSGDRIQSEQLIIIFETMDEKLLQKVDFTVPFYNFRNRFFISPDYRFNNFWMLDIYSWNMWSVIFLFCLLFTSISMLCDMAAKDRNSWSYSRMILDNYFCCFGAVCNQCADICAVRENDNKILLFCISIFSWLLISSFSSQIFVVMTQTTLVPPFKDLDDLLETDYVLLLKRHTAAYRHFQVRSEPIMDQIIDSDRVRNYENYRSVHNAACSEKFKGAVFHSELINFDNDLPCKLEPIGRSYWTSWCGPAVPKEFSHKESLNHGILRLHETGIIAHIIKRWTRKEVTMTKNRPYEPINFEKIFLPVIIYLLGLHLSIIIVIVEFFLKFLDLRSLAREK